MVNELGLQSSSYIDVYNCETGLWEQHKISTVRTVEQDQRLLYRLRPSLLDGLTDCPSLDQELTLQPNPIVTQLKRQIETPPPSSGKLPRVIPSGLNPVVRFDVNLLRTIVLTNFYFSASPKYRKSHCSTDTYPSTTEYRIHKCEPRKLELCSCERLSL